MEGMERDLNEPAMIRSFPISGTADSDLPAELFVPGDRLEECLDLGMPEL